MDDSRKSKGSNSSALPVLDPVSEPVSACVASADGMRTDDFGWGLPDPVTGKYHVPIHHRMMDALRGKKR